ncbi:MAG: S-layer homology domain-containing protein [Oscillospiraceae bacterium]|nr:S-layer homology domain-containing protein [Oscillospiraceae bacterium]
MVGNVMRKFLAMVLAVAMVGAAGAQTPLAAAAAGAAGAFADAGGSPAYPGGATVASEAGAFADAGETPAYPGGATVASEAGAFAYAGESPAYPGGAASVVAAGAQTPLSAAKVEIAFVIDASTSMSGKIDNAVANITALTRYLESRGVDVKTAVIEYGSSRNSGRGFVLSGNNGSWHTSAENLARTLSGVSVSRGAEALTDAMGLMLGKGQAAGAPIIPWSDGAHKFAVVLTDAYNGSVNDKPTGNSYGYGNLAAVIPDLQAARISVSVATLSTLYSRYRGITEQTGGKLFDLKSTAFWEPLADHMIGASGIAVKSQKAIYVIPGYLGSELYDSTEDTAKRLWVDISWGAQVSHESLINNNPDGSGEVAYAFGSDMFANGKDAYGTIKTYTALVDRLKKDFGREYDVKFFPYNWLGDINETVKKLEADASGYRKVVLVTHSTGGLVAAAYVAKSATNRARLEKAVMIAPPLYGTYASLFPLERGDSKKAIFELLDAATNNEWVKKITRNSPTTYQLLPSKEYFSLEHALDLRTVKAKMLWDDKWIEKVDWSEFYGTLGKSENINASLLSGSGNPRSHRSFRSQFGGGADFSIVNTMSAVDTTVIGTVHGKSTPLYARYDVTEAGKSKLVDIKYEITGDSTVQGVSLGATLNEAGDAYHFQIDTRYFTDVISSSDAWAGGIKHYAIIPPSHTGLVKYKQVLDMVSSLIKEAANKDASKGESKDAAQVASYRQAASGGAPGMSIYIKLRIESEKDIFIEIYDKSNRLVASCGSGRAEGFDGDSFICDQFGDDGETITSIYMPKEGYKAVFKHGGAAGVQVGLAVQVGLLDYDGNYAGYGGYYSETTIDGGEVFTLDMTDGVTLGNLEVLASATDYPGLVVVSKVFDAWEFDFSGVNKPNDVVVLDNIGDTAAIGVTGKSPDMLVWASSDESVIAVRNGVLTAVGHGRAVVTAVAADGSGASRQVHVKVTLEASSIEFDDMVLLVDEWGVIYPQFCSERVTEKRVEYAYDAGAGVVVIIDGVVHGLAPGQIVVTGTAAGGASSTFTVTVVDAGAWSAEGADAATPGSNPGGSASSTDDGSTPGTGSSARPSEVPSLAALPQATNDLAPVPASVFEDYLQSVPLDTREYVDVARSHWAHGYIRVLTEWGIIDGYPVGNGLYEYRPDNGISRAEIMKLIAASLKLPLDTSYDGSTFDDWDTVDDWAKPYAGALVAAGVVLGSQEGDILLLNANKGISRQEMTAMAVRALNIDIPADGSPTGDTMEVGSILDFSDVADWAGGHVAFAINYGMLGAERGRARPTDSATRAEAAMMLYKMLEFIEYYQEPN